MKRDYKLADSSLNNTACQYLEGVIDMIEVTNQFEKKVTEEVAAACVKIGNCGYRLTEEDYERLKDRAQKYNLKSQIRDKK